MCYAFSARSYKMLDLLSRKLPGLYEKEKEDKKSKWILMSILYETLGYTNVGK